MLDVITVAGQDYRILFPDLFRPLTEEEYGRLHASILARGVQVPILIDDDDPPGVIDGGHRLLIAAELGQEVVPHHMVVGSTPEAKRELAESVNDDRRHLSPEEQQARRALRVERVVAARRAGKSTRAIAEAEGISQSQVVADLELASTEQGCSVEPPAGKVTGRDGKKRAARKKKASTVPRGTVEPPAEANGEAAEATPQATLDEVGLPIPDEMAEAFAAKEAFAELAQAMRAVQKQIAAIAETPGGAVYAELCQCKSRDGEAIRRYSPHIKAAIADAEGATPCSSICPWCHDARPGKIDRNCNGCGGRGWVPRATWRRCPQALKDAVTAEVHA